VIGFSALSKGDRLADLVLREGRDPNQFFLFIPESDLLVSTPSEPLQSPFQGQTGLVTQSRERQIEDPGHVALGSAHQIQRHHLRLGMTA
jgi:hypothetical protein